MRNTRNTQMNDQQRAMVVENMKYADRIAANYVGRGMPIEDLEQEARLAMCYAAMRFDPSKGCTLVTFSTLFINGWLCKFIMRHGKKSYLSKQQRVFVRIISLERLSTTDDDGDEMSWEDTIANPDDDEDTDRAETAEMLNFLMTCLTDEERQMISTRFGLNGEDDSIAEKARQHGVSVTTFNARCNKILLKMAEYAEKYRINR